MLYLCDLYDARGIDTYLRHVSVCVFVVPVGSTRWWSLFDWLRRAGRVT